MTNHTHRFRATLLVGMASIGILLALYGCGGSDDPSPSTQFTLSGQVTRSLRQIGISFLMLPGTRDLDRSRRIMVRRET
jgi:hypothetical protein